MIGWMTSTDRKSLRKSHQMTFDSWTQRTLLGTLNPRPGIQIPIQ
jgi:hypothetical protein